MPGLGRRLTFIGALIKDLELEVGAIPESRQIDDLTLEIPNRDERPIERYSLRLLLRLELVMYEGRHSDKPRTRGCGLVVIQALG